MPEINFWHIFSNSYRWKYFNIKRHKVGNISETATLAWDTSVTVWGRSTRLTFFSFSLIDRYSEARKIKGLRSFRGNFLYILVIYKAS